MNWMAYSPCIDFFSLQQRTISVGIAHYSSTGPCVENFRAWTSSCASKSHCEISIHVFFLVQFCRFSSCFNIASLSRVPFRARNVHDTLSITAKWFAFGVYLVCSSCSMSIHIRYRISLTLSCGSLSYAASIWTILSFIGNDHWTNGNKTETDRMHFSLPKLEKLLRQKKNQHCLAFPLNDLSV